MLSKSTIFLTRLIGEDCREGAEEHALEEGQHVGSRGVM